jgi:apolipoprotein D and lipocalin family protein
MWPYSPIQGGVIMFREFLGIALVGFTIVASTASSGAETYRDQSVAIEAIADLDLERYQGRWFEIARFPFYFERDCFAVTADYALRDDGTLSVLNQCAEGSVTGNMKSAEGVAWRIAGGQLKVSFVPIPFLNKWIAGDYWILSLDEDYKLAVIGSPKGKTGWILARQPRISDTERVQALATLRQFGYDTEQLIYTEH